MFPAVVTCRIGSTLQLPSIAKALLIKGRWVISEDNLTGLFSSCSMYHQALEEGCYWIIIRLHFHLPYALSSISSFDFIGSDFFAIPCCA